jgi:membrane-associated phospholipid phosphatase
MNAGTSPVSARTWFGRIWQRIATLWYIKSTGTMGWIAAFFVGYFWVLRNPMAEVTTMPFTALDRWIAFRPEAVLLYVSLWVYVSIPPALVKNFRELFIYGLATFVLSVLGLAIFLAWPTAVPAFELDFQRYPLLTLLKGVDLTGNACPSLHVAFAVFSGIWVDRLLREIGSARFVLVLNWLWCFGIVYSTLATRQHVVIDVVAGAILGALAALLHVRALAWYENRRARSSGTTALERQPGS